MLVRAAPLEPELETINLISLVVQWQSYFILLLLSVLEPPRPLTRGFLQIRPTGTLQTWDHQAHTDWRRDPAGRYSPSVVPKLLAIAYLDSCHSQVLESSRRWAGT